MRTRYAPTPSGYLHLGNAAHLVLVSSLAQSLGADVLLRIDDVDDHRVRQEYLDDIFDLLTWLDLPWSLGPRSSTDMTEWSQQARLPHYRRALGLLAASGSAYVCQCSRAQWQGYHGSECPGECRARELPSTLGQTSWRLHLAGHQDPVIWRRDDIAAYHLTSVVDDDLFGIDMVIRGADLHDSTEIQRDLSRLMPGSTFHAATVLHHPLVKGNNGTKLSKSSGVQAQPLQRSEDVRRWVLAVADELSVGLNPPLLQSPGS